MRHRLAQSAPIAPPCAARTLALGAVGIMSRAPNAPGGDAAFIAALNRLCKAHRRYLRSCGCCGGMQVEPLPDCYAGGGYDLDADWRCAEHDVEWCVECDDEW